MMPVDNDPDHTPIVLPRVGAVSAALSVTRRFCQQHDLDPDVIARLAIIVEELVMNLVEHADRPDDNYISLTLEREFVGVRVVIEDDCAPFDPRAFAPQGELPPDRGGGAGIRLVMAWSRALDYRRVAGRNRLTLIVPFA